MSEKMTTANSAEQGKVDIDFAECAVPKWSRRRFVTMFMIMLGFTFFSASMWVGQEMAAGLDFWGFIKALLLGGAILGIYTGLLGYVGAETGLSLDLLSKRAFGEKGSYISSALTSFTQIGWFGVGIAMFAIPVARELFGGSTAVEWVLILIAGACMTASAYFGIKALTVISYIAAISYQTLCLIQCLIKSLCLVHSQYRRQLLMCKLFTDIYRFNFTDQNLCFRRNCNTELHTICKKW